MPPGPFVLVVTSDGKSEPRTFDQDVVTIGRSRDCDVFLADRLVSRLHCRVLRTETGYLVADAGAQNPARLHGRPVVREAFAAGDVVVVGNHQIALQLPVREPLSMDETRDDGGGHSGADLVAFLQLARALNEQQDLHRLLTQIVDAAIALCGAERGFLILGAGDGHGVEVARNFAQEEVLSPEFKISRTIANRVLASGVAELTTNAQEDDRFRDLRSVADLRLRSVLCSPIRVEGRVEGVLYIDNRLQQQVFQEREKALLVSLADHAGTAIHNARAVDQLRRQQTELQQALQRVDQLNAALQGQLHAKSVELSQIREVLGSSGMGRRTKHEYAQIIGQGRAMQAVFALLDKYTEAEDPVLITGDSGTGKELVARAIHKYGRRSNRPFVSENCAALPEALLESELFGYVRGAFTGATANKKGLLEAANGGVLFLDEVGDMPLDLQAKLLRVLQEGEVRPIGSRETVKVDVRLVCATNRNLAAMVREGSFREDLYYRLAVLPVHLPPLRDRREDLPLLVKRMLADLQREHSQTVRLGPDAMACLVAYPWPGNVRELQNELRRAAILSDGLILAEHFSQHVREGRSGPGGGPADDGTVPAERGTTLPDMVRDLEVREIQKAFHRAQANKSRAAELLGLSRFALQRKLDKYALDAEGRPTGAPAEVDDGG